MSKAGKKSKQLKPAPDFRHMYELAERYSEASGLLQDQARGTGYGCSAPMLLVDSFAVELYLKCLHVLDNNQAPRETHNWKDLFDELKPHTKVMIREAFDEIVRKDPVLPYLKVINPEAPPVTDFATSFDAAASTFDGKRYVYEGASRSGWFYAQLIRNAIRNLVRLDMRLASIRSTNCSGRQRAKCGLGQQT